MVKNIIAADVLENTNFVKDHCCRDKIVIVLDYVIDDILMESLLELRQNDA